MIEVKVNDEKASASMEGTLIDLIKEIAVILRMIYRGIAEKNKNCGELFAHMLTAIINNEQVTPFKADEPDDSNACTTEVRIDMDALKHQLGLEGDE